MKIYARQHSCPTSTNTIVHTIHVLLDTNIKYYTNAGSKNLLAHKKMISRPYSRNTNIIVLDNIELTECYG